MPKAAQGGRWPDSLLLLCLYTPVPPSLQEDLIVRGCEDYQVSIAVQKSKRRGKGKQSPKLPETTKTNW
jgi:hypothetical protein